MSHPGSKLTPEDVQLIRAAVAERERLKEEVKKLSNAALAEKFGVSPTTISCVANYWYHYNTCRRGGIGDTQQT